MTAPASFTTTHSSLRTSFAGTRLPSFGKGSRVFRTRDAAGLTDEQLRHVAPSAFALEAHSSRSARYTYIPTSEILTGLRREGFLPMEVRQAGSRIEGKEEFTKHMIRFRHAGHHDLRAAGIQVGESIPEIVLVNSHDGTSSYQLMSGLFRVICQNGLIAATATGGHSLRIPHSGDIMHQVIDGCVTILEDMPGTLEKVGHFQQLALAPDERRAFARAALQLRYEDATPERPAPVNADTLLRANRHEDNQPSLWHTLNTVQENTVQGGQFFRTQDAAGRARKGHTREVKGIDGNVALNRALWTLAEEMRKIKNA